MSFGGFKDKKPADPTGVTSSAAASLTSGDSGKVEAYLGRGAAVVGTLSFAGPVEIDCAIEGEIHAQGALILGESANIQGKVYGAEVTVRGTLTGDLTASKRLTIKKPARIVGNISCPVISIEEGVHFEGRCSMVAAVATNKPNSQPNSQGDSNRPKIVGSIG